MSYSSGTQAKNGSWTNAQWASGRSFSFYCGGHGMCIIASLIMQETSPWRIPSVGFLLSYWESLTRCSEPPLGLNTEGKQPASASNDQDLQKSHQTTPSQAWRPPPPGWIKINVDGSSVVQTGEAGVGAIGRDSDGHVIFTAWRSYSTCGSALEAEALACVQGR